MAPDICFEGGGHLHIVARFADLVGRRHALVEHLQRDRNQRRVRDPRAVMAVAHLALLVRAHLRPTQHPVCEL